MVTEKGTTLHVLQGNTCDPGLIFHWRFPRRLELGQKWLAVYVALSRVRALSKLRSIGMTIKIRKIIEGGPPEGTPKQFEKYFGEKEKRTKEKAESRFLRFGWNAD